MFVTSLILGVLTLIQSYVGVGYLRRWTEHRLILDLPNERSSHTQPTPRGGGLVIAVLSLLGLCASVIILPAEFVGLYPVICAFLVAAVIISTVSWLDDLKTLSNRIRFFTHFASALIVLAVSGSWRILALPSLGNIELGMIGFPITLLWIVGLTNAYNFMDGIDGIAGGQAVVAGTGWAVIGAITSQPLIMLLGTLVAASSLGFLGHNWPPARIFMGDVGSAFLGFTFAFLAVVASKTDPRLAVVGVVLVWPFVFDAGFTFLRRLLNRENIFAAHRSHLYQRLVIAGYSHRFVTLLYSFLALVGVFLALLWVWAVPGADWLVLAVPTLLSLGLWRFVVRAEARPYPDR